MATQNKNFKVKNGLDVSGTATADAFALSEGGTLEALPSKTGQSGKYLSTDGTDLLWDEVSGGGGGASVVMSTTAPENPTDGTLWVDTDSDVGAATYVEKSIVDASGDLLVGSGSSTVDRLAVGSNGQVLIADSGQPKSLRWGTLTSSQVTEMSISTKSDSHTLSLSDAGTLVAMSKGTAQTVTVPTNAVVPFPVGTKIDLLQTGAGETSVSPDSGVTLNSEGGRRKINAQWQAATLLKTGTDSWVLLGALKA